MRNISRLRAKKLAEGETITIGQLRHMICARRGSGGMSAVNPAIPLDKVLDIYLGALEGRPEGDIPRAWRPDPYSRSGRMRATRDQIIVTNILRDCYQDTRP